LYLPKLLENEQSENNSVGTIHHIVSNIVILKAYQIISISWYRYRIPLKQIDIKHYSSKDVMIIPGKSHSRDLMGLSRDSIETWFGPGEAAILVSW